MALPQPGTCHMPLPFPTAPGLAKYFPSPGPAPSHGPSPAPSPLQESRLQGHSRVHGLIVAVLLPHCCGRGDIGGPSHGPQGLHEVSGQRGLRGGTTRTRQGCTGKGLIAAVGQGHEAKWPRQDLNALRSPGPTLEQQLRRPRAVPSASTLRRAMSQRDRNGNSGTALDQDTALPRSPSVPPPY